MSIFSFLKLMLKDFKSSLNPIAMVILSLGPALFLLGASLTIKHTIHHTIESESQSILGGDIEITSTAPFKESDDKWLTEILQPTDQASSIETISNVTSGDQSALADIKGVSKNYPLVSANHLEHDVEISSEIWKALGLKDHDQIQVGLLKLNVTGPLIKNLNSQRFSFSPALPLYLDQNLIFKTGLIAPGSLVYYRKYFLCKLPSLEIKNQMESRGFFIRTSQDAVKAIEKGLNFALQIVDLAVLFLSLLCLILTFYSLNHFLQTRNETLALFTCFGVHRKWRLFYIFALSLVTVELSFLFSVFLLACLILFGPFTFQVIDFLQLQIIALILTCVVWGSYSYSLKNQSVFALLKKDANPSIIASLILGLLFSFILALVWFENKFYLLFFIGFELLVLLFSTYLLPQILKLYFRKISINTVVKLALRNLKKPQAGHILLFQTFFTALFIQLLLLHFSDAVQKELSFKSSKTPQFFLTNIQDDDLKDLINDVQSLKGLFENPSPLYLGRLEKINGVSVQNDQLKRFPLRMTVSQNLKKSESIFSGNKTVLENEVSLEVEFANRFDLHLGDHLQFELQGLEVSAQVSQLRRIEWNQFQPNFFIQFPVKSLQAFPHSLIGTVRVDDAKFKDEFQVQLLKKHPAVSVIDIGKMLQRLSALTDLIKKPLTLFLVGVSIFLSGLVTMILYYSFALRKVELALLEIFGASNNKRRIYIFSEFLFLFLFSFAFADLSAHVMAGLVLNKIFHTPWTIHVHLFESFPLINIFLFSLPMWFFIRQGLRVRNKDLI